MSNEEFLKQGSFILNLADIVSKILELDEKMREGGILNLQFNFNEKQILIEKVPMELISNCISTISSSYALKVLIYPFIEEGRGE
jgi:hypothetical protein